MAIIQCQNCGNDVSDKAKQCPHCQSVINDDNGIENILNNFKVKTEISNANSNNKKIYNRIARKFDLVVWIIKFLGYLGGIISLIILTSLDDFIIGLVVCIVTCIVTWLSTLLFEAIAEGLQLLEDIKNK